MVDFRELTPFVPNHEPKSIGSSLAWSPDSTRLAFVSGGGTVQIWNVNIGAIEHQFNIEAPQQSTEGPNSVLNEINDAIWTNTFIAVRRIGGLITLCEMRDTHLAHIADIDTGHAELLPADISASPNGQYLVAALYTPSSTNLGVWEIPRGKLFRCFGTLDLPRCFSWSRDGKLLAVGLGGRAQLWDLNQGRFLALENAGGSIRSISIPWDGTLVAAKDRHGRATIWRSDTGRVRALIHERTMGNHYSISFSPKDLLLATLRVDAEPAITIWETNPRRLLGVYLNEFDAKRLVKLVCGGASVDRSVGVRTREEVFYVLRQAGIDYVPESRKRFSTWLLERMRDWSEHQIEPFIIELARTRNRSPESAARDFLLHGLNAILFSQGLCITMSNQAPTIQVHQEAIAESVQFEPEEVIFPHSELQSMGIDYELCEALWRRWNEAKICFEHHAFLAGTVLIGSVLEGLLLGIMRLQLTKLRKWNGAHKEGSKVAHLHKWPFYKIIEGAHWLGLIRVEMKHISHALREYRNIVHVDRESQLISQITEGDYLLCQQVLETVVNNLVETYRSSSNSENSMVLYNHG
jgi:WD40-like Beta Propeller Repeat